MTFDKFLDEFFHGNALKWRLFRTIIQGIIAVIMKALASGQLVIGDLYIPLIMCILSPIMAEMGKNEG